MSREEVFKATGPTSGSSMWVKIGVKKDGKITAAERHLQVPGRRLPRLAGDERLPVRVRAVRHRERPHGRLRRGVQPAEVGRLSRARLADLGLRGRERARHVRQEDRHGPAGAAPQERRQGIGTPTISGPKHAHDGYIETLEALHEPPRLQGASSGKNQGRGVASGYWFNGGGEFERDDAGQRRRHRAGGDRQPGHRRLARLDGDHGGRDAGRRLQPGAGDRRRHRLGRLHARHRRLARDLRDRHRGGERHQERDQGPVQARRDDLGRRPPKAWSGRTATPSRPAPMSATSSRCR